ncbi:hypothetical protein IWT25_02325 [Secundilactobacillus pentosiphilus]|uniref:Phage conserved hypothetical protein C-terminal domain-containing protein n=1 Tax=Secundilactobacillus pentosiphilus TaxID=1714682 RepID=A0A1Z5IYY1_9LACO|nr:conserved phage C-terminal domain-containing protein [Secundilactobacillus pentosiphilus]GAX06977.1 hypothetical protein IWT25_02325 [Secundilactobacillus pentosiphilus]
MTNNLLISEPPLQVLPSLAIKVGLNEAIILQQFHYWLQRSNNIRDGEKWIYNSYAKWAQQFPFFSVRTVKRTILSLEENGYLISGNFNTAGFDKTKWYRINYEKLGGQRLGQNDPTSGTERPNGLGQSDPANTNRLPETTQETTKDSSADESAPHYPYQEVIDYLNAKTGKKYRNTKTNQGLMRPRFNEGFTLSDFKKAIDHQVLAWGNDPRMSEYLRPSTLFRASKFEGYVNHSVNGGESYGGIEF